MSSITRMIPFISLYLDPKDVFLSLSLVCKQWHKKLSGNYLSFWLRTNLSFQDSISLKDAKLKLHHFFKQEILNFNPWFSTGGMGTNRDYYSFRNMWNYNGLAYSTYFAYNSPGPFNTNICCAAYFAGGFQSHNFYKSGHCDLRCLGTHIPAELRDFKNNSKFDMLNLAPIFPEENIIDLYKYNPKPKLFGKQFDFISGQVNGTITFSYDPCKTELAFVNKIAIARPIYYTTPIRTVVIFFSQTGSEDINLERFNIANDLVSIENAKVLGVVDKEVNEEKIKYLEFKKRDEEWYPVVWIQFQTWKLNHFEIDLQRIHQVGRVMVKLIDASDCREIFHDPLWDPDYDILYCLFLGTSIIKEGIKEAKEREEAEEI